MDDGGEQDGPDQGGVAPGPEEPIRPPHSEDVSELREDQRRERHRLSDRVAVRFPDQERGEGREAGGDAPDQQPSPDRIQDPLRRRPGRPLHRVTLGGIDRKRYGRQAVGEQVDDQYLHHGQWSIEPEGDREGKNHHLPSVGRKQEVDEAQHVLVDGPASSNRRDDRRVVVVGEHQVGRRPRRVGPALAHRDADVGGLQSRDVVDAIPGHRHHLAMPAQGVDDADLVPWNDARIDADIRAARRELIVRKSVELNSRHHVRLVVLHDPRFACYCQRGSWMVTRDHHGAHPGFSRFLDASRDPGTRRVVDSQDAERGELGVLVIACRQLPLGDDQHAHSLLSPALAPLPEARPIGFVDKSLDHLLRRALREEDAPIGEFDRDAHPLPLRVEGLHPHDVPFSEQPSGVDPVVGSCRRDRRFDRFNRSVGGPVRCSH